MRTLQNVLVINDFDFINGGTSQIAINTANSLAEAGYNVYFFSAVSNPSKNDLSPRITRYCSHQFDILQDPSKLRASIQGIWNTKAASLLTSLLKKLDSTKTIVHIHGWIKALSPSIGQVLSRSGFLAVLTMHDYFIACPNGGFFNYQTRSICHLKPMSAKCICTHCDARSYPQKVWRVARQSVQQYISRLPYSVKNLIAVSHLSKAVLSPFLPKQASVFTISNPVNYPFQKPIRANVAAGRCLFIGRLSPEKGIDIACEAARLANVRLTVIGDGELRETLGKQYPMVEFKGWLAPADVFKEMLQATALVFPSILYETFGLAVLEAFSVGLPVVVSDQCAASELVNGRNGLLFKSGDVNDLAAKMKLMFADLSQTEQRSNYIFEEYWKNPLTIEKYTAELVTVYNTILKKGG